MTKKISIRRANRSRDAGILTKKKPTLINLNYPPPDMTQKELAGYWGELTPEQLKESEEADRRAKERIRTEHRTRYSYGY